ncbi:MAG TPA: ribonuclease III [Kiritimatiellia bacterium]|nr:ribonuclease III [Kiritimatiellia bacterium]HMP34947.1 ribonuclease III [Kiritimatiellia bacterium]
MYNDLMHRLGYTFHDPLLLTLALTHTSARYEHNLPDDNQRLEYLGDAALGLVTAAQLYLDHPHLDEGELTVRRSQVTSTTALATVARAIDLGPALILGRGEEQSGGRDKPNNLADAIEAILGAAYLDGGLDAVRAIFDITIAPHLAPDTATESTNYKGILQEWAQRHGHACPTYRVIQAEGPAHQRSFTVTASLDNGVNASGSGSSKRAAEQRAAKELLDKTASHE